MCPAEPDLAKLFFGKKSLDQGSSAVQRFSSIFSPPLQLFPCIMFEQAVNKYRSGYSARGLANWVPFVAMHFNLVRKAG